MKHTFYNELVLAAGLLIAASSCLVELQGPPAKPSSDTQSNILPSQSILENPYSISQSKVHTTTIRTIQDLINAATDPSLLENNFVLEANLDLKEYYRTGGAEFQFGDCNFTNGPFKGAFDGKGNTIKGFKLTDTAWYGSGLFACAQGATIKDLNLLEAQITLGNNDAGLLVGAMQAPGMVSNVTVSGDITGRNHVGGVVGKSWREQAKDGLISFSHVSFSGTVKGDSQTGGFAGLTGVETTIQYAKVDSQVEAIDPLMGDESNFGFGGGVGVLGGIMRKSKVTTVVSHRGAWSAGGIVGDVILGGTLEDCEGHGFMNFSYEYLGGSAQFQGSIAANIYSGTVRRVYSDINQNLTDSAYSIAYQAPSNSHIVDSFCFDTLRQNCNFTDDSWATETYSGWDFSNTWTQADIRNPPSIKGL